jgi:hypothetical protein
MAQDMEKLNGDDIEIKPDGNDIDFISESKFLRWWDNYWYHYKWHTIIAAFVIFLIVFIVGQQASDPKQDIIVTYCGPMSFLSAETEDLREAMNRIMPEDFDENGEKYAEIVRYAVYSEAELEADRLAHDGQGTVNLAFNAKQMTDFNTFMSFGECSVYLLSEYMYEYVKPRGALKPLADALGETPEGAHDEYSVYLKDTPYYALEPALQRLPEDTLVCITAPYDLGNSSDPEYYARSLAMLRAIVLGK